MENEELVQSMKQADALFTKGQIDEAFDAYMAILEQYPDEAWPHSRVGAILAQRGELEQAEQALLRALELDPELPQAHSNLGNIHYTRGEFDKAIERYQTAAKLDPTSPIYHENLHAAYKQQKKYSEAVKALKHSHKLVRETANKQTQAQVQGMKRRVGCTSVIAITVLLIGALLAVGYVI